MPRVKRGVTSNKTRRNILKRVKGFRFGRSKKEKQANEALVHAGRYAYNHRKKKKGDFRRLWNIKIGAGVKNFGLSYSTFISKLKKNKVELDRKVLAEMAEHHPETFAKIVEEVK
ncbi:MAG TPA: 50S ribosomal protein L20 [Candidatus Vogelbacteria bacterium]|nr:50S ribosomal protein L20 [Candidatus Vogelbacteria bacterium]